MSFRVIRTALGLVGIPFSFLWAQDLNWHGFVQTNYTLRTTGRSPDSAGSDFVWGDQRFQLKFSTTEGTARAFAKADLFQDALSGASGLEVREAFLDYRIGNFDLRAGRQIITWGVGDLLFINDVFPKDWQSFFSGRPMEYLKEGIDGVKAAFFTPVLTVETAVLPFFEPDRLPPADRFFFYNPFSSIRQASTQKPASKFENVEVALRAYRTLSGLELTGYIYRGFQRTPAVDPIGLPNEVVYFYPKLSVFGASAQKSLFNGIFSLEYGFDDSRQDRQGNNPFIPNSFHKLLAGYQRQGWTDFSYSFQFYGEAMQDYDAYKRSLAAGTPRLDRYRALLTLRATQLLKYQTWKLSLFAFFSPTDQDYYTIPEVQYKFTDRLWLAVGGNIFGGEKETTFFGQYKKNDNLYSILRYEF